MKPKIKIIYSNYYPSIKKKMVEAVIRQLPVKDYDLIFFGVLNFTKIGRHSAGFVESHGNLGSCNRGQIYKREIPGHNTSSAGVPLRPIPLRQSGRRQPVVLPFDHGCWRGACAHRLSRT